MQKDETKPQMPPRLRELYTGLMDELDQIIQEDIDGLMKTERCIGAARKILETLREYILTQSFSNTAEEVFFFKHIKPVFYSEYIYYHRIYQIEILRPTGSYEEEINYLQKQLKRLNDFFQANLAFYQYVRSGAVFMDESYFVRGRMEKGLLLDYSSPDADPRFCTSQDYKLSRILANERLKSYLNSSLDALRRSETVGPALKIAGADITWTAPKAALIELIYALESFGAFNHGETEIKQIADHFERAFNINLGNFYRTFQEIRIRKKGRTYFLDEMKAHLVKRMDQADENPR